MKARGVPACLRNRWQAPVFNIYTRESKGNRIYAFDLIELNDDDLRRDPLEGRKARWK